MKNVVANFLKDEEGATMIEYALLAALISIAAIAMISGVGKSVNNTFDSVNNALSTAA